MVKTQVPLVGVVSYIHIVSFCVATIGIGVFGALTSVGALFILFILINKEKVMSEKIIYEFDTALATLRVYEDYCELEHKKNAANFVLTNKYFAGKKKFYYSDLTAVQFREAGKITDGYLEFEYPGARSGNSGGAYQSENSIAFASVHSAQMKDIYAFIDEKIKECKLGHRIGAKSSSSADDLVKYSELLEKGLITPEEFEEKKQEVLSHKAQKSDAQEILERRQIEERRQKEERDRQLEIERALEKERRERELQEKREEAARKEQVLKETIENNKPKKKMLLIEIAASYIVGIVLGAIIDGNIGNAVGYTLIASTFVHLIVTIFTMLALKTSSLNDRAIARYKKLTTVIGILGAVAFGTFGIFAFVTGEAAIGSAFVAGVAINIFDIITVKKL